MKLSLKLLILLVAAVSCLSAAPQWTADEFVGLADGDEVIVDSKLAGSSSITVISNTIGMKGVGHSKRPKTNLWLSIEREGQKDIYISLQDALKQMNSNGFTTIDLGVKFQEGDEIEIGQMVKKHNGSLDFKDFDLDAVTDGFVPKLDHDDYKRPGFNGAFGVDNYFQSYVDDDKGKYNGEFIWTFGNGIATPTMPDFGGDVPNPNVPETPVISGQPLPGTMITLIFGTMILATVHKNRRSYR